MKGEALKYSSKAKLSVIRLTLSIATCMDVKLGWCRFLVPIWRVDSVRE